MCPTVGWRSRDGRAVRSRQEVVERAAAYLLEHLEAPIPLSRICRMVGRSERGLRDAFYAVHQMSPKQWVLAQRLQRARRALIDMRSAEVTVTSVAMDNGFNQLGRFAGTYRQVFGETPSATLRGHLAELPRTKGHTHVGTNSRSDAEPIQPAAVGHYSGHAAGRY